MVQAALHRLEKARQLGDMTLFAQLGEGGMATVYLAAVGQGSLARMAAVKLLKADLPDHDYRTRFVDEARVVVRLHHNNLVDVRAAGEHEGQLFIAMEAIEGRDLAAVWDRCAEVGRAFPVGLAVYLCRECLRGLHYAHTFPGLSLVHRDVSPSNILIDWAGAVRLADFGLATSTLKASMTVPGIVFGKVGYMSPEQARRFPLDGRADVYAIGVVLWELLTGRPMRSGQQLNTDRVARFEARAPSEQSRRVDAELDAIVMKALAHRAQDRWSSAEEMLTALNVWLAEHEPTVGQESCAAFLAQIYQDTRSKEHCLREALLREMSGRHPQLDRSTEGFVPAIGEKSRPRSASASQALPERTQLFIRRVEGSDGELKVEETMAESAAFVGGRGPGAMSGVVSAPASSSGAKSGSGARAVSSPKAVSAVRAVPKSVAEVVASEEEELRSGMIVDERYRVLSYIGRGGMGTVYLGEHLTVGRKVAIKVLTLEWSHNEAVARRFRAEARAASAAGHPGIVEVFDAGELEDGRLFLVMEFLQGQTLFDLLQEKGRLELEEGLWILRECAKALRAAHGVGVIHRDLKPENIMLLDTPEGDERRLKVLDFGISSSEESNSQERWTQAGQALGTPVYMAPEQARGEVSNVGFDIYALGVMAYEMFAGVPPFSGTLVEVMSRKAVEEAPSLAMPRPDLGPELVTFVNDCLALEPTQRPASMGHFLDRIAKSALGVSRKTTPPSMAAKAGDAKRDVVESVEEGALSPLQESLSKPQRSRARAWWLPSAAVAAMLLALWGLRSFNEASLSAEEERPAREASAALAAAAPAEVGGSALSQADRAPEVPVELPPAKVAAPAEASQKEPEKLDAKASAKVKASARARKKAGSAPGAAKGASLPPPPLPRVEKEKKSKARAKKSTANCEGQLAAAKKDIGAKRWQSALRNARSYAACGGDKGAASAVEVRALFEMGEWDECIKRGKGSSDRKARKYANSCKRRKDDEI